MTGTSWIWVGGFPGFYTVGYGCTTCIGNSGGLHGLNTVAPRLAVSIESPVQAVKAGAQD